MWYEEARGRGAEGEEMTTTVTFTMEQYEDCKKQIIAEERARWQAAVKKLENDIIEKSKDNDRISFLQAVRVLNIIDMINEAFSELMGEKPKVEK
jgi:hypothetical protein